MRDCLETAFGLVEAAVTRRRGGEGDVPDTYASPWALRLLLGGADHESDAQPLERSLGQFFAAWASATGENDHDAFNAASTTYYAASDLLLAAARAIEAESSSMAQTMRGQAAGLLMLAEQPDVASLYPALAR